MRVGVPERLARISRQGNFDAEVHLGWQELLAAEASNGQQAIERFRQCAPDVTLMDLRLPDMSGIDAMIAIRSEFAEARIIILTTFAGDVEIQRSLEAGARGYLLKSMPPKEMVDVIRHVHAGKKRSLQKLPPIWLSTTATKPSRDAKLRSCSGSPEEIGIATSPKSCSSQKKP